MTTMASPESPNKYLLEEMVWCLRCNGQMRPASRMDRSRYYSCGIACEQPKQLAIPLEQDLLLRALVRAHQALLGVGRRITDHPRADPAQSSTAVTGGELRQRPSQLVVTRDELRRWQYCDITDRRALLVAAFIRVMIDADGTVHAVWDTSRK